MAKIELKGIKKIYSDGYLAVDDFNINIDDKEFIVFVGPSGCGKSTTLRMIAGLEDITEGDLLIDGKSVKDKDPKDRNIAMVFQNYALYPHMTVYDNMAFSLKLKKVDKEVIHQKVINAAKILGLLKYLKRKPKALSGGQRQRVALGRAIVREPKVFLMDEPLSNLDAKLRVQTRTEIIKLHEDLGLNTIYVTHDQIEALTMATRIVVMKDGIIQQIGTPKEVYDHPENIFVGGFIGTPPMNFIPGKVTKDGYFVGGKDFKVKVTKDRLDLIKEHDMFDKELILGFRPEQVRERDYDLVKYKDGKFKVKVSVFEYLGDKINVHGEINGAPFIGVVRSDVEVKTGMTMQLAVKMMKCHFFDKETGIVLKPSKKASIKKEVSTTKKPAAKKKPAVKKAK